MNRRKNGEVFLGDYNRECQSLKCNRERRFIVPLPVFLVLCDLGSCTSDLEPLVPFSFHLLAFSRFLDRLVFGEQGLDDLFWGGVY